jgi:O-antigen/teichoic acid export membrane protein
MRYGAVFDFSSYLASVIQVPQRSLVSTTIPILSRAWKEKDLATIDRIYKRSSLNLLLVSIFIFSLIWINYDNAIATLDADPIFREGKWVVFFLAVKNIIDMGTGVNGQIIATSTYWRFDFFCGIILLLLAVPLNIYLVRNYGIIGSAWSTYWLIQFTMPSV